MTHTTDDATRAYERWIKGYERSKRYNTFKDAFLAGYEAAKLDAADNAANDGDGDGEHQCVMDAIRDH